MGKFLMNRKNKFLWGKNSLKNKELKSDFQKAQAHINEKLLIVYAFFETEIFLSMIEDVAKVNLSNENLETIKKDIFTVTSSENYSPNNTIKKLKIKYSSI